MQLGADPAGDPGPQLVQGWTITAEPVRLHNLVGGAAAHGPGIRVILPTDGGLRSVLIEDLVPLATAWSIKHGSEMA